jgi:hypothetical protein
MSRNDSRATKDLLRNVSSTFEEKYQTWDGNVTVTNVKRGLWMVHPRGHEPLPMAGSKKAAFAAALGWSAKHGKPRTATHVTHAAKKTGSGKKTSSTKIDLERISKMFGLPEWNDLDERNGHYYWEAARGAEDPEAAEQEAREDLYRNWHDAVTGVAERLFGTHGLEIEPVRKSERTPFEYKIVPKVDWKDAANKIRETLNGIGYHHYSSLKEFLDSGPYTAQQAVLSHLGTMSEYPAVYGGQSARSLYDAAMR